MTAQPPYENVTKMPERFRNVPYENLPPAIKTKVDAQEPEILHQEPIEG